MTSLNIAVLIKQVPASSEVDMNRQTGTLIRSNSGNRINPYDLFALECALQLKQQFGATVTAITMGPSNASEVVTYAYAMGVDNGILASHAKFGGADVLATSNTLADAIVGSGQYDLILCGQQTTDGDTAQVGASVATLLGLPWLMWVNSVSYNEQNRQFVAQCQTSHAVQTMTIPSPCLLSVTSQIGIPRIPTLQRKLLAKKKTVSHLSLEDMPQGNISKYGVVGSPTRVRKLYLPQVRTVSQYIQGTLDDQADFVSSLVDSVN